MKGNPSNPIAWMLIQFVHVGYLYIYNPISYLSGKKASKSNHLVCFLNIYIYNYINEWIYYVNK